MAEFDRQVEIYWVRQQRSDCDYQEQVMYKKVMIAKRRGNDDDVREARNHPRPACIHLCAKLTYKIEIELDVKLRSNWT